jgi:hypothetical protein
MPFYTKQKSVKIQQTEVVDGALSNNHVVIALGKDEANNVIEQTHFYISVEDPQEEERDPKIDHELMRKALLIAAGRITGGEE